MITDRSRFLLTQTLLLIFSFLILINFFDIGGVLDLQLIYPFIDNQVNFPFDNNGHWQNSIIAM